MNKDNIIKIIIGVFAICVIVITFLNQSGITEQIHEIKTEKKMAEEKRNWTSKEFGDMKMAVTIYDQTQEEKQLGAKYVMVSRRSHKYPNYSDDFSNFGETVEQIKEESKDYNKLNIHGLYEPKGKYSKLYYYFCFVPFDCDYVLIEGKKYKAQSGRIKTKKAGLIKFRMVTFLTKEMLVHNYNEKKVAFYDTAGNVHKIAEE